MNTMNLSTDHDVAAYLAAVRAELSDLPSDDLDDLTGGLEADLTELVAESTSGLAGLGSPQEYATELRSAAGIPPRAEGPSRDWWSRQRAVARDSLTDLMTDHPLVRQAHELAVELKPAWWIVRGVVLAWMIVLWGALSVLLYPLAIVGALVSVHLGRRRARLAPWPRRAMVVADVLAVWAVVMALATAVASTRSYASFDAVPDPQVISGPGLQFNGTPTTNLYVYDREGKPLTDVRIFTDSGQPVDLAQQNPGPDGSPLRGPTDIYGHPWDNTFPVATTPPPSVAGEPGVWSPPTAIPPLGTAGTTGAPTVAPTGGPSGTSTTPSATGTTDSPLPRTSSSTVTGGPTPTR